MQIEPLTRRPTVQRQRHWNKLGTKMKAYWRVFVDFFSCRRISGAPLSPRRLRRWRWKRQFDEPIFDRSQFYCYGFIGSTSAPAAPSLAPLTRGALLPTAKRVIKLSTNEHLRVPHICSWAILYGRPAFAPILKGKSREALLSTARRVAKIIGFKLAYKGTPNVQLGESSGREAAKSYKKEYVSERAGVRNAPFDCQKGG